MARRKGADGAETEAAICRAALRLIATNGYEAVTMRGLAEEVDLAAGALYRYFPNKQAILFTLLERHMTDLLSAWAAARLPRDRPATDRLEAFTRFHVRHHLPRANGVFLSYMELRSLTPANFAAIERLRAQYEADLVEILDQGRREGDLTLERPALTARAIIAMLTGITTWYRADGPLSPRDIECHYWAMVARMLGASQREETECSITA